VIGLCAFILLSPAALLAQDPAPAAPPAAPAAPDITVPPERAYAYDADGRRDPFLNLLVRGVEPARATSRPDGVGGLTTNDLTVRGVVQSRGELVAMVQGPDRKTYTIKQGDALSDGTVKAVMTEGLVILQDVNDPLSLVKQREVRKLLRSVEDSK
jgi:Tfp pilus assembly protein PilP